MIFLKDTEWILSNNLDILESLHLDPDLSNKISVFLNICDINFIDLGIISVRNREYRKFKISQILGVLNNTKTDMCRISVNLNELKSEFIFYKNDSGIDLVWDDGKKIYPIKHMKYDLKQISKKIKSYKWSIDRFISMLDDENKNYELFNVLRKLNDNNFKVIKFKKACKDNQYSVIEIEYKNVGKLGITYNYFYKDGIPSFNATKYEKISNKIPIISNSYSLHDTLNTLKKKI